MFRQACEHTGLDFLVVMYGKYDLMYTLYCTVGEMPNPGVRERSQQGSCLLEVGGVKPCRASPVDGCQRHSMA
jgi:hypothetical protein